MSPGRACEGAAVSACGRKMKPVKNKEPVAPGDRGRVPGRALMDESEDRKTNLAKLRPKLN